MPADRRNGFEVHRPYLRNLLARIAGDAEAEDLVQDVLLIACRKFATFRGESNVRGWLRRIAINRAINTRAASAKRRWREGQFALRFAAEPTTPFEMASVDEALERARAAYRLLPNEWREVLRLRLVGSATLSDVAEAQGVCIGTVHRRETLAKTQLATVLEQ